MIRNMEEIKIMPGGQWDWSWEDVPTSRAKVKSSHVGPRVLVTQGWFNHWESACGLDIKICMCDDNNVPMKMAFWKG